jgi:TorA maturation chaperone TorD
MLTPNGGVAPRAAGIGAETSGDPAALSRARLYHFFELALAHPGEDGIEHFRRAETEQEFFDAYAVALGDQGASATRGADAARIFFSLIRQTSFELIEAAHIGLFSTNYPSLPCPPYGSLFTAPDSDKRLEHMLAIKAFYQENGVDIADTFDDLPDHLCVELEFLQLLAFRESDARATQDFDVLEGIHSAQRDFLDWFFLPLANGVADLAAAAMPTNPYSHLLEAARSLAQSHRLQLGMSREDPSLDEETQS